MFMNVVISRRFEAVNQGPSPLRLTSQSTSTVVVVNAVVVVAAA
jgi:hypothetical protein